MKINKLNETLQLIATILGEADLKIGKSISRDDMIKFFKDDANTNDDKVHALADQLGMSPHDLESQTYKLLNDVLNGRLLKNWDVPDSKFDSNELKMGIEVEKEHTDDEELAKIIAKSHLLEIPNYYTLLKKMEGNK